MLKKLTALFVAVAFSLMVSPLVATSSFAQAALSNAPPNGEVPKKDQPSHKKVKQPATSMSKKKMKR